MRGPRRGRAPALLVILGLALAFATLGLSGSASADASNPATTTVLTVSPTLVPVGSPVTLTATVTGVGGAPTGSVRFVNGTTEIATVPLTAISGTTSQAVLVTSSLPVGSYAITANYNSSDFFSFSNSASLPVQLTISGATIFDTTTTVSANPATVETGQPVTLTAHVARIGDSGIPTGRVTFSDNGVSLGEAVLDATGTATLTRSDFIAGSHSITASYSGDIVDRASGSAVTLPVTGSSSAVQTTTTVTATPNPIVAGRVLTITAHVVQTGTQTPPPGGTFVTFRTVGVNGAFLAQAPLDANGNATVSVAGWIPGRYVIEADYVGDVFGRASSATVPVVVGPPGADLSLGATAAPSSAHTGGQITYSFVVANAGIEAAQNVVLTDQLPAGTSFVSVAPGSPTCAVAAGVVTCPLGTIASGGRQTVTLVVAVAPGAAGTTITNTARVTSTTPDPNTLADNTATVTTDVRPSADVSVTGTGTAAAFGGDPLAYSFTVTNAGPEAAANVVLTDVLPSTLTGLTFTTTAGTCSVASGQLTCQLGTLAPGALVTVNVGGTLPTATGATTISNSASVSSATDDPSAANNTATVATRVTPLADLGIAKFVAPPSSSPGGTLTYVVTVSNLGPGAGGALLSFPLPPGTTFLNASPTTGTCTAGSTAVTCDLGTLAAGASATATINVVLSSSSTATSLTSSVSVSAVGASDRNPANNSATATVPVLQATCQDDDSVEANEDFKQVVGGKSRTIHFEVDGKYELDRKTGKVVLHHGRLRVQVDGQSALIDVNQDDGHGQQSCDQNGDHGDQNGDGDHGDQHGERNSRGGQGDKHGEITRIVSTGPSDAVITGTWAGTAFTVTLHDGGAANKNDTVRVQYGSFDTGTLTLKHGGVHVQHH